MCFSLIKWKKNHSLQIGKILTIFKIILNMPLRISNSLLISAKKHLSWVQIETLLKSHRKICRTWRGCGTARFVGGTGPGGPAVQPHPPDWSAWTASCHSRPSYMSSFQSWNNNFKFNSKVSCKAFRTRNSQIIWNHSQYNVVVWNNKLLYSSALWKLTFYMTLLVTVGLWRLRTMTELVLFIFHTSFYIWFLFYQD